MLRKIFSNLGFLSAVKTSLVQHSIRKAEAKPLKNPGKPTEMISSKCSSSGESR
jgi:hypothetical protein